MHRAALAVLTLGLSLTAAHAADRKPTRFWNLTANTIVSLQMSPAGQQAWGRDQCENDRDHEVDHDERLRITGVEAGTYDAKLTDVSGRTCLVRNIKVEIGQIFSIEEKELTSCTQGAR